MIEGFKIKLTSAELKQHCVARAAYHARRADEKEAEMPGLEEALAKVEAVTGKNVHPQSLPHMNKSSDYNLDVEDPVDALESDIRDHRNKSLVFRFFSEHLFDEDYVLDENGLIRLEIIKSW